MNYNNKNIGIIRSVPSGIQLPEHIKIETGVPEVTKTEAPEDLSAQRNRLWTVALDAG